MDYKLIIIGAGPGGYETALLAARRGIETVLIEAGEVGGTCLNEGCIPTKAFCRNAQLMEDLAKSDTFGVEDVVYSFDFSVAAQRKNAIVEQLKNGVKTLLANPRIQLVQGTARFVDAHTVAVGEETFTAENIIIATGSTAAMLPIPGNDLPGVITSRELLDIDHVPHRLCIIGAGVIGLEFASIFTSFGSEVTVVEYAKEILPRFDSDMAKRLRQSLGKRGITITTQAAVSAIAQNGDELTVTYTRKGKDVYMVVFNPPYSKHLVVKTPVGTEIVKAVTVNGGNDVKITETARNEYNVDMPDKDPGEPFVIKLETKEKTSETDKYRDALT